MASSGFMATETTDVTGYLLRWREGDSGAFEDLVPLVYKRLRELARSRLNGERLDHSLDATDLVHETYVKLASRDHPRLRDRSHFFTVAALLMRRLLVDHARRRNSARRGGDWVRTVADEEAVLDPGQAVELIEIDELLTSLSAFDRRKARVVELRFFAGMTIQETARALEISPMTVVREWRLARAWITQQLTGGESGEVEGARGPGV